MKREEAKRRWARLARRWTSRWVWEGVGGWVKRREGRSGHQFRRSVYVGVCVCHECRCCWIGPQRLFCLLLSHLAKHKRCDWLTVTLLSRGLWGGSLIPIRDVNVRLNYLSPVDRQQTSIAAQNHPQTCFSLQNVITQVVSALRHRLTFRASLFWLGLTH